MIHCTGKFVGYLRTEKSFHDYKLTVEWRFVRVAPRADNTGILVHMQSPDTVWPPCVQVQGKHDNQGDLLFMAGAESKEHRGKDANTAVPKRGPVQRKAGRRMGHRRNRVRGKFGESIRQRQVDERDDGMHGVLGFHWISK